jgi:hypothetical protein
MDWLLDASAFMTRDRCGQWTPWLTTAYVGGSTAIALAYYTIPVTLAVLAYRRRQIGRLSSVPLRYQRVIWWFAAFILLCGTTHVCDVLAFRWPAYRAFTAVTLATGLVSCYVAVRLPWLVREAWDFVPAELVYNVLADAQAERDKVKAERDEVAAKYRAITADATALKGLAERDAGRHVNDAQWWDETRERFDRLNRILSLTDTEDREAGP